MTKFLYFDPNVIKDVDPSLAGAPKKYHDWFVNTYWNNQGGHIKSRVHALQTPWPLTGTVCEMPTDLTNVETDFGKTLDKIATETIEKISITGKTPYLFYSGGIDSVSILISLFKNADKSFLDQLIVVCNNLSIQENPYFYDRFIQNRFRTIDTDSFTIDPETYDKIIILDGECGNQCMGSGGIYELIRQGQWETLAGSYTIIDQTAGKHRFSIDLVKESLQYSPVDIKTLHDFFWWGNFNFKFDEVLLRKILVYTASLTAQQRKEFYYNNLIRMYAHPDMQKWSLVSAHSRLDSLKITTKYFPKKYIYDFDNNEIYYIQKRELGSDSPIFMTKHISGQGRIGLNENWEIIDFADASHRKMIKNMFSVL